MPEFQPAEQHSHSSLHGAGNGGGTARGGGDGSDNSSSSKSNNNSNNSNKNSDNNDYDYSREVEIAIQAAARAAVLTDSVFHDQALLNRGNVTKSDASPVTVGDFGAQAILISALHHHFPSDGIVAEEEAGDLRDSGGKGKEGGDGGEEGGGKGGGGGGAKGLRDMVWSLVQETCNQDPEAMAALGGPIPNIEQMLALIDLGQHSSSPGGGGPTGRFWTIDPIDGTKGFLSGGQYAVCLALVHDSRVRVGVLACPNMPVNPSEPLTSPSASAQTPGHHQSHPRSPARGLIFSAVAGRGAFCQPLWPSSTRTSTRTSTTTPAAYEAPAHGDSCPPQTSASSHLVSSRHRIQIRALPSVSDAIICESRHASHSAHSRHANIARSLGIHHPSLRIDSQAKYASIARGVGDIYIALPSQKSYILKSWDHAPGSLILTEAGGTVSDEQGNPLDFSQGRLLTRNKGIVGAPASIHASVVAAVKRELAGDTPASSSN